jgi:glycosyltransferase involved in cell wall biosynthesis
MVSHPHGGAVSVASAAALERQGRLTLYASGAVAAADSAAAGLLARLARRGRPVLWNRILKGIEPRHVRALAPVELAARLVGQLGGGLGLGRPLLYDALFTFHDAAVAALPWPRDLDAIYAYEDGALLTFRRAARRPSIVRIWDLPLPHHATLARIWREQHQRWPGAMGSAPHVEPEWKRRRKDQELALADVVSVASRFAKRSVEELGVERRVVVAPYGFPVEAFAPKVVPAPGPFTVLAVGTHDLRKGTPYLLEAWRLAGLRDARLRLVGPLRLDPTFVRRYQGLFEHVPHLPKHQLAGEYQAADLLAFPTLGDGFGLVIQEAMCCATPVVTTTCGGGPECIDDGVDGWLVEAASVDALVERLRAAAADRSATFAVGQAARRRAERSTWREAGAAFVAALAAAVDGAG